MMQIIKLNPQQEFPIMGVKLVDKEFADAFVNQGVVHFSDPKTWRDRNKCNGLQLDEDDGRFCYSTSLNDRLFRKQGRKFERISVNGGWKYFEDTDMIVGSCFYGILLSNFSNNQMIYGVKKVDSQDYCVSVDYFDKFNVDSKAEKKTIIIYDMYRFCDLLVASLVKMGIQKEDIHLSMVYYVNKQVQFGTPESFPFEYFLKDSSFSSQSEFRVIIASKNKDFYKALENNGNNIVLGDISSFAVVQDKYDTDLYFSIQEDKLFFKLAKPITLTLDERSFAELVGELYQIKQNHLPGEPREQEELDVLAKPVIEHLNSKYGVEYRDDWRLYNVPDDLYDTLPEIYKGMCYTPSKLEQLHSMLENMK